MNVHVFYVLEHKTNEKISICLSVCLSVYLSVCLVIWLYVRGFWLWTQ